MTYEPKQSSGGKKVFTVIVFILLSCGALLYTAQSVVAIANGAVNLHVSIRAIACWVFLIGSIVGVVRHRMDEELMESISDGGDSEDEPVVDVMIAVEREQGRLADELQLKLDGIRRNYLVTGFVGIPPTSTLIVWIIAMIFNLDNSSTLGWMVIGIIVACTVIWIKIYQHKRDKVDDEGWEHIHKAVAEFEGELKTQQSPKKKNKQT